jgi:hypothetical protein
MMNTPPESVSLAFISGVTSGSQLIQDTETRTGEFIGFLVIESCGFTSLTGNHLGWEGSTYPSGLTLTGEFTEVKLSHGSIILFDRGGA